MNPKTRSIDEASSMLRDYENDNLDLDEETRRQLAVFVLAPMVGSKSLNLLYRRPMGQTPFRHRSWMWYTAMVASGIGQHWDEFAGRRNKGTLMRDCLIRLRRRVTREQWLTLSRRLGVTSLREGYIAINPYWYNGKNNNLKTWTRGGVWDNRSNFTKIIVQYQNIERDHSFRPMTQNLTPSECRSIEQEVWQEVDEEALLYPDAIHAAVAYVRHRIPAALSYKRPVCSYRMVSWFFQTRVPCLQRGWVDFESNYQKPIRRSYGKNNPYYLEWLPNAAD